MMGALYLLLALGASMVGSVSGIGGGVIIKPVMDCIGSYPAETVSFLSGCTVLSMALVNFARNLKSEVKLDYRISIFLAAGASVGGLGGRWVFSGIKENLGQIQAVLLLAVNIFVLIYVLNKDRIRTKRVRNLSASILIGLALGFISAFLGIGGGPVNIAVLYYFFSMETKETARNSLFIILFSQAASLAANVVGQTVPPFLPNVLVLMCLGGVVGAMAGSSILKRVDEKRAERIFFMILIVLIGINIYNVMK